MDFDKAKNLDGYTINIGVIPGLNKSRFRNVKDKIHWILWDHLKANVNITFNKNDILIKDVNANKLDYMITLFTQGAFSKRQTYPMFGPGLCVAASRIEVSIREKFLLAFHLDFWLIILTIGFGSVVYLRYLLKLDIISSIFEILKMILNSSSLHLPHHASGRILFAVLIFSTLFMNSYLQSSMNSIFIAFSQQLTIDTMDDLEKSNLDVYGSAIHKNSFEHSAIFHRYQADDFRICLDTLFVGEPKACIFPCSYTSIIRESENIHVAAHSMNKMLAVYHVREDWPLLSRFDEILRKMSESGFITLFDDREKSNFKNHFTQDRIQPSTKMCKRIEYRCIHFDRWFDVSDMHLSNRSCN